VGQQSVRKTLKSDKVKVAKTLRKKNHKLKRREFGRAGEKKKTENLKKKKMCECPRREGRKRGISLSVCVCVLLEISERGG
jgi:predicted Holliday junction resolvase-like endonuclease